MTMAILAALAQIGGLMVIGWLGRRLGYISRQEADRWSHFAIDFLMPLLIFSSTLQGLDVSRLNELWQLPAVGFGIVVVGIGLGFLLRYGLSTADTDIVKTFVFFCGINNYGYLPIIITGNLGGHSLLASLFLLNLGSTLGLWLVGINVLGAVGLKGLLRNLLAPSLIALLAAVGLALSGLRLPQVILTIADSAGVASTPIIIILMGASLADIALRQGVRDMAYSSLARLIVVPLACVGLLRLLPVCKDAYNLGLIVALMPVGISTPFFASRYGGDPDFAARATLISTIAAVLTVPVAVSLLGR
jgi:predicted permease